MPSLAELKSKSPAYAAMSDDEFAGLVYRKHYAGKMGFDEFAQRVGHKLAPDPTEGMSGVERFAAGVGKSIYDTGRGIGQLFGMVDEADIARARELDRPLMETGAGLAGNIAGQTAQVMTPIPAGAAIKATSWAGKAAPYVGAAARSGAFGGL